MRVKVKSRVQDLLNSARQPFNIIEEYAALNPKRKVLLCDQLFMDGKTQFRNMVKLLWPEAKSRDMKTLENFLLLIKKASQQ